MTVGELIYKLSSVGSDAKDITVQPITNLDVDEYQIVEIIERDFDVLIKLDEK